MTTPLVIIGAGGFGRETAEAVRATNAVSSTWDLVGFADDDPSRVGSQEEGVPVLGQIEEVVSNHPDAQLVICTGRPDNYFSRPRLVARLAVPEWRYATVIHPAASVGSSSSVGVGSVLLAGVVLTAAARVGSHVAVMPGTVVTHDDVIGDFATVATGVRLGGSVVVGRGAYLGAAVMVRQDLTIGQWALLGMGSLVTRSVPSAEVWYGSPARPHGQVDVPPELLVED
jgi:sugar O-acyltransferase (sialic acid O-acetyltransferase NeuD family)